MSKISIMLLLIAAMSVGIKLSAFRDIYSITTIEVLLISIILFDVYVIICHRKRLCIIKEISKDNFGKQPDFINIVHEYEDNLGCSYEVTSSVKKRPACIVGDKVYRYVNTKNVTIVDIAFWGGMLIISAFLLVMTMW